MKGRLLFAIVPVKGLDVSKERLSRVLNPEKRKALTAAMLRDILNALKSSTIREVLVISPDSSLKQIADEYGFSFVLSNRVGLNPGLKEAIEWCTQKKADCVLILPADIPLVSPHDIDKVVELGSERSTVVLCPSLDGGTNALLLNPPDAIPVCFGPNSFYKHIKEALDKGVTIKFYSSREMMLDVDAEEDLIKLLEIGGNVISKQVLTK